MLKAFVEKVIDLAKIEYIRDEAGREYTSKRLIPVPEPVPPLLMVDTLRGLVDYLRSGFDEEEIGRVLPVAETTVFKPESLPLAVALHVKTPHVVDAFLPVREPWKERVVVVSAQWTRSPFPFGTWMDQENFLIKLQAMFMRQNHREEVNDWQKVMDVAAKIICEDRAEITDNGIAQAVTVSRGVKKESGVILPNPVILRPVRTFTEVEQPASSFVFRMRSEPVTLSLHEADMGAWEMEAKQSIKMYLEGELPGVPVFV